jgi:hypothetical protein
MTFYLYPKGENEGWSNHLQILLIPGDYSDDYLDLTPEQFQAFIDNFPVYIDQQYL